MQQPASPCTSECTFDPDTGWCRGCFRTLDEIACWSAMTSAEKWEVLREAGIRRGESEPVDS